MKYAQHHHYQKLQKHLIFSGKDISKFYLQCTEICENYKIKNKIQRVTRYMDSQYVDYIKIIKKYDIDDWEVLKNTTKKIQEK